MSVVTREALIHLRDRAADLARSFEGVKEESLNSGKLIDRWLARVHLPPGKSWCAAFVIGGCYYGAWKQMLAEAVQGLIDLGAIEGPMPIPVTGHCATFWHRCPQAWKTQEVAPHSIAIHLKDPANPWTLGHMGIVVGGGRGTVNTIDGNTNEAGHRDGDCVAIKTRPREYWAGFIDIGRDPEVTAKITMPAQS